MGDQEAEEIPLGSATMQSDYRHKPQQVMFKVIMDIQEYDYVAEYLPGKTNIADYLSLPYRADEIKHDLHVVDVVIYHGKRLLVYLSPYNNALSNWATRAIKEPVKRRHLFDNSAGSQAFP